MSMDLQTVDVDSIMRLRQEGKWAEAQELLEAWRKNVKDNTAQLKTELEKRNRLIKKIVGRCVNSGCNREAKEGKYLCVGCVASMDRYNFRKRQKKVIK